VEEEACHKSDVSCAVITAVTQEELLTLSKFQLSVWIVLFYLEHSGVMAEVRC